MINGRRRRLLLAVGPLLLVAGVARAQGTKPPVVAYLFGGRTDAELAGPDPKHPHARAFVHRLRELGWSDGRSISLERYGLESDPRRTHEILANLTARNVAAVYAASAVGGRMVAAMAMQATRSVPIVFAGGPDPVAMGLVASLARPGGNVTGVAIATGPELVGKRLELLKEIAPAVRKVLYLGTTAGGGGYSDAARQAAARLKLDLLLADVDTPEQLDAAFARATRERAEGFIVGTLGFLGTQAARLVAFAAERRLPAVYSFPEATDAGGLASFGIDFLDLNRRAADYVDRILRGTKPADLPVELPKKFEVVLNLKTARSLGLRVPQSVLLSADRIVD